MSVRAWLLERAGGVPESLRERIVDALGDDAESPRQRAPEVCLAAATRLLRSLLENRRFARDSAIDLLAVDALMTYAYEFAALSPADAGALAALTRSGMRTVGSLAATP